MKIAKTLTPNDLGLTGGHQAGLHIPKNSPLLDFLPRDQRLIENPRVAVTLVDLDSGHSCCAKLIFYNNALRGGTRDEYRMTGTTAFLRKLGAAVGDELIFDLGSKQGLKVQLVKGVDAGASNQIESHIKLNGKWRFIGGTA
jgi:hypothetical protein